MNRTNADHGLRLSVYDCVMVTFAPAFRGGGQLLERRCHGRHATQKCSDLRASRCMCVCYQMGEMTTQTHRSTHRQLLRRSELGSPKMLQVPFLERVVVLLELLKARVTAVSPGANDLVARRAKKSPLLVHTIKHAARLKEQRRPTMSRGRTPLRGARPSKRICMVSTMLSMSRGCAVEWAFVGRMSCNRCRITCQPHVKQT